MGNFMSFNRATSSSGLYWVVNLGKFGFQIFFGSVYFGLVGSDDGSVVVRVETGSVEGCTADCAGLAVVSAWRRGLMNGKSTGQCSVRSSTGGVPLVPDDITIAELLRSVGYKRGCFGK